MLLKIRAIKQGLIFVMVLLFILTIFIGISNAAPQGPRTLNVSSSGRNAMSSDPLTIQAEAGNVTALVIDSTRITQAWQGYYGNVTGTIILDDAENYTFYDWTFPNPTGEVYASNGSSVTWTNIYCMNVSGIRPANGSAAGDTSTGDIYYFINGSEIELNFGINVTDTDGLNETFNATFDGSFEVGSITIDSTDGCSEAHPYVNEKYDDGWEQVLLTDNESLIFTSIMRVDADMYKSVGTETADFQMLVLENGHAGSESTTTPYYFYVELT